MDKDDKAAAQQRLLKQAGISLGDANIRGGQEVSKAELGNLKPTQVPELKAADGGGGNERAKTPTPSAEKGSLEKQATAQGKLLKQAGVEVSQNTPDQSRELARKATELHKQNQSPSRDR